MQPVGINISVNSDQVQAAKNRLDSFNTSLRQTRDLSSIEMHVDGFDFRRMSDEIKGMAAEIRSMQGVGSIPFTMPAEGEIRRRTFAAREVSRMETIGTPRRPEPGTSEPRRKNLYERRYGRSPERQQVEQRQAPQKPAATFSPRTEQTTIEKPASHYDALIRTTPRRPEPSAETTPERHEPERIRAELSPERRRTNAEEVRGLGEHQKRILKQMQDGTTSDRTQLAARLAAVKDFYGKLAALDRAGSRRGGTITAEQATEAKNLYEQLTGKARELRNELKAAGLENDRLAKQLQDVHNRAARSNMNIGSYRQQEQQQGNPASGPVMGAQFMRKAAGWAMAAAGIGTIGAFVGASRSAYRSAIDEEAPLYARGIRGSRQRAGVAAGIGMNPAEWYGLEDALSRNTGLNERTGLARSAMLSATFAKSHGVDTAEVAGFRTGIYNATGDAGRIPDALLTSIGKGLDKSRMHELLQKITLNTGVSASAMHGAALSRQQVAASAALADVAMQDKGPLGTYAKSQDFANIMQNGMQGAGSPVGDIMTFKAMGGFEGDWDFAKVHKMNKVRSEGFLAHPDILKNIFQQIGPGDQDTRAGKLETFFKGWGIDGKASELMLQLNDSGFLDRVSKRGGDMMANIKDMSKSDPEAARWLEEIKKNPALGRQSIEATKDLVKIEAGEKLSKLFEPLELSAAKLTGALVDGKWQQAADIFGKSVGEMGPISKTLLAAGGLFSAGAALSFAGGAIGLAGKAGGAALLSPLLGPGGLLALAGLGGAGAYNTFKNGAEGANYLPTDRKNALTGKAPVQQTAFNGVLNSDIANNPRFSPRYKEHAVQIYNSAKKYGVPEALLAGLLESESDLKNVKPRTIKYKSGKTTTVGGIGQFTDETAKRYGIDRMDPNQAIDAAAHLLSDNYKQTGSWRGAVKLYKGVADPKNDWQTDTAFTKAEKYIKNEPERQALQGGTNDSSNDNSLRMIADILAVISGHTQTTATNTTKTLKAPPLTVGKN